MADGDFLSGLGDAVGGLLNIPSQALNAAGGVASSLAQLPAGILNTIAPGVGGNGLLSGFFPQSGAAQGAGAAQPSSGGNPVSGAINGIFPGLRDIASDPTRMALLQMAAGMSQPSPTKAGVWGNAANGFVSGLQNSQDQLLKRQLMAAEVQKNQAAMLPQISALVESGALPKEALTQALNRMGIGQAQVPGAPSAQGASVPGQAGSSGGAPGGITSAPLPAPPGAQAPNYGPQGTAQPAGAPSVPNQAALPGASTQPPTAGAAATQPPAAQPGPQLSLQQMAAALGVQVPYTIEGQQKLRDAYLSRQGQWQQDQQKFNLEHSPAAANFEDQRTRAANEAKDDNTKYQAYVAAGQNGIRMGNTIGLMRDLAADPNFWAGTGAASSDLIHKGTAALGYDAQGMTSRQLFDALRNQETSSLMQEYAQQMKEGGGANARIFQKQVEAFDAMAPDRKEMTQQSLNAALANAQRRADTDARLGDEVIDYKANNGKLGTGWDKRVNEVLREQGSNTLKPGEWQAAARGNPPAPQVGAATPEQQAQFPAGPNATALTQGMQQKANQYRQEMLQGGHQDAAPQQASIPTVSGKDAFDKLPAGTQFYYNGQLRVKH